MADTRLFAAAARAARLAAPRDLVAAQLAPVFHVARQTS
jgi:hypothetical protein